MYFELTAPDRLSMERAYWDAQVLGLDPVALTPLTFNIGTGNIEKVSRLRDKYNLTESYTSDYICVTEGEIDCITLSVKTNHPAVGIPGANNWKPFYTRILDDFDTVIVLADGDGPGLEFGKKIGKELSNVNIIQMPEGHDVNSIVHKEGVDFINERIARCLNTN